MKCKKSLVATLVSAFLCVPAISSAEHGGFHKKLYIGGAGGITQLSPEVEDGVNFTVDEEESEGQKIFVGWDFSPRLAVEFGVAELGEAMIGPADAGEISYSVKDLSLLYHFFNFGGYDSLSARTGLGAFGKLGVGTMENESDLAFERENDWHAMGGLGVEYGTSLGLALRGEVEFFDEDAMMASLGLLWRIGGKSKGMMGGDDLFSKSDMEEMMIADDADGDGVPNNLDDCPDTSAGDPVSATGCAMFGGVLAGVQFSSGSDELTDEAQVVLNDAADVLLKSPDTSVEVQAHTDSQGSADYNLDLSKKRALAVVRYLMLRGVPAEQLQARAFGESKPIEDNATAEGRNANRRVEFHVSQ